MTLQDKQYSAMEKLAEEVQGGAFVFSLTSLAVLEVTLSLDTIAYASGEVLADTQEVASALRVSGGDGKIVAAVVLDKDDQAQGLDLIFMRSNESLGTENSAPSMTDTEAEEITGAIEVAAGDYVDLTNNQVALVGGLNVPVYATTGTSIYMGAISRGTGTYTASGIVVKLFIEQY